VKLTAPLEMNCLKGFDVGDNGFQAPAEDGSV
jgi:hypothetical protein